MISYSVKGEVAEVLSETDEGLDDSSAAGKLGAILAWAKALQKEGRKFSYFPEPSKKKRTHYSFII